MISGYPKLIKVKFVLVKKLLESNFMLLLVYSVNLTYEAINEVNFFFNF